MSTTKTAPVVANDTDHTQTDANAPDYGQYAAVVREYPSANRSRKAAIRTELNNAIRTHVMAGDLPAGQTAVNALNACATERKSSEPTDYAFKLAQRVATLRLAADMLANGTVTPDGFPTDWERPETMPTDVDGDSTAATVIASAKIVRSAVRRDLGALIVEVVPQPCEYMSVRDVANAIARKTDGEYGTDADGAIAARLFPTNGKCTLGHGIVPVPMTSDRPRGLRRTS